MKECVNRLIKFTTILNYNYFKLYFTEIVHGVGYKVINRSKSKLNSLYFTMLLI